jgi:hypothetical protein
MESMLRDYKKTYNDLPSIYLNIIYLILNCLRYELHSLNNYRTDVKSET